MMHLSHRLSCMKISHLVWTRLKSRGPPCHRFQFTAAPPSGQTYNTASEHGVRKDRTQKQESNMNVISVMKVSALWNDFRVTNESERTGRRCFNVLAGSSVFVAGLSLRTHGETVSGPHFRKDLQRPDGGSRCFLRVQESPHCHKEK